MKYLDEAKMLINFYNMQASSRYRLNSEDDRRAIAIDEAIERSGRNLDSLKNHIKKYLEETPEESRNIRKCFESYINNGEEIEDYLFVDITKDFREKQRTKMNKLLLNND